MKNKILIVEDEEQIALGLQLNLEAAGFETIVLNDGLDVMKVLENAHPHLVILDIMLPGMSGFKICDMIRSSGNHIPILFLTAKDNEDDRIKGLKSGGDDYITKPFSVKELIERIKAIFRRQLWYDKAMEKQDFLQIGESKIDLKSYTAYTKSGEIKLTSKECMLLNMLAENENQVIERNLILDQIWGQEKYPSTRTIDNLILRLRKYFEEDPKKPKYILSQYGKGYMLKKQ